MSKFEVGDKVKAYNKSFYDVGYIACVGDNKKILTPDGLLKLNLVDGTVGFFHPKQCRKLVKKSKLHPQDPRGYKDEPKFKAGDFVTHINGSFDIGRIIGDSFEDLCGDKRIEVLVGTEKYHINIENLQKLNIKCED